MWFIGTTLYHGTMFSAHNVSSHQVHVQPDIVHCAKTTAPKVPLRHPYKLAAILHSASYHTI